MVLVGEKKQGGQRVDTLKLRLGQRVDRLRMAMFIDL